MRTIHPVGTKPQAFIKFVLKGGTKTAARLQNQMDYLGRKGEIALERAERYQGNPVNKQDYARIAAEWFNQANTGGTQNRRDFTTHLIVSFPAETNHASAKAASRAFAAEMFGSGNYGGRFDYITAYHTNKPHPHLHIMVNRRSLEDDNWLKISSRDPHMNYDNMRQVVVETAAKHGVYLEATSRNERGITGNPIAIEDYYRLARDDVFFSTSSKPRDERHDSDTLDPDEYETDDRNLSDPHSPDEGPKRTRNEGYEADTEQTGRKQKRQKTDGYEADTDEPQQLASAGIDEGYDGDDERRSKRKDRASNEPEGGTPGAKRNRTGRNR